MRDYRDAKAMAHALRDALQAKTIETTHSECLELIAKTFGYENWNILSAKIEAAPDAAALAPAASHEPAPQKALYCSFCGKSQHDVRVLIAGPTVFICGECVAVCNDVIEDREIWSLLEADEESGNQAYPAAVEHVRAKSTEDVASCVERSRRGAERSRLELHNIERVLAVRDAEAPAADLLAWPRFAQMKNIPRKELLALGQRAERAAKRYEDALRIATTVLDARGP
jgi:hypothetical protein